MRFEELAAKSGRAAADTGRRAQPPPLGQILHRRRRTVAVGLAAAALVAVPLTLALLWPESGPASPAGGESSSTSAGPAATTTLHTTTTLTGETPAPLAGADRTACQVTEPADDSFVPATAAPEGPPDLYDAVWYGTPDLWTMVDRGGQVWEGLPLAADGTLTQKTFWWSDHFGSTQEQADIGITLEDLSGATPPIEFGNPGTSGGRADIGVFMLVGIQIPGEGCWRVTADYRDASLSYVVWVGPDG